jgi:hypothetical protein
MTQRMFAADPISYVGPGDWVLARPRHITDKEFAL